MEEESAMQQCMNQFKQNKQINEDRERLKFKRFWSAFYKLL